MHYGPKAFGKLVGEDMLVTIVPINQLTRRPDPSIQIGQRDDGLSPGDIAALNMLYPRPTTSSASNCSWSTTAQSRVSTLLNIQLAEARDTMIESIDQAADLDWDDAAYDLTDFWMDRNRPVAGRDLLVHFPLAFREAARLVGRSPRRIADPQYVRQGNKCVLVDAVQSQIWDLLRFQAREDPGSIRSAVELAVGGEWDGAGEDFLNFWVDRSETETMLLLSHFSFALRKGATLVGKVHNDNLFHDGQEVSLPEPGLQ